MSTHSSIPPERGRPPRRRRFDAHSALTEAQRIADPSQLARLLVGSVRWPGDLDVLDRYLEWVGRWTSVKVGGMTDEQRARQKQVGSPRDGRSGPYPGRPRVSLDAALAATLRHPPADNEAHFRWMMLVHSGLYELKLSYTAFRKFAGVGETTMRVLLHGEVWGTKRTRRELTWHLLVQMLLAWGLEDTVTFVESGGNWLPEGIPEPVWYAEDGRVQVQPMGVAVAPLETVYLRVAVLLPDTAGSDGHQGREVTLVWPPVRPPSS